MGEREERRRWGRGRRKGDGGEEFYLVNFCQDKITVRLNENTDYT